jgi:hypothetical protein
MQDVCCAFAFALASAGSSIAARMAMMAMTTSNSINVNAAGPIRAPDVVLRCLALMAFPRIVESARIGFTVTD